MNWLGAAGLIRSTCDTTERQTKANESSRDISYDDIGCTYVRETYPFFDRLLTSVVVDVAVQTDAPLALLPLAADKRAGLVDARKE